MENKETKLENDQKRVSVVTIDKNGFALKRKEKMFDKNFLKRQEERFIKKDTSNTALGIG